MDWMGLEDAHFEGPRPAAGAQPEGDAREVLHANTEATASLAEEVEAIAARESLHDYGRFRLAVLAIDAQPVDVTPEGALRSLPGALHAGTWSADARLLAIGGLLRALGYAVVPQRLADGIALALPVSEDMDALNANLVKASVRVRRGRGVAETVRFAWLLWTGGRIGAPRTGGELLLPVGELIEGPERTFSFARRTLPAFTLRRPEPRLWPVPGDGERALTWHQHDDARRWLAAFPALHFAHQAPLAREELATLDLQPSLDALLAELADDAERVDTLLRAVQHQVRYEEGPLRSLYDLLEDRCGDCDQLSLLLAALLVASGWSVDDLRVLQWPGHLALGVRSRDDSAPDGTHVELGGARFHALDGAYVTRTDDIITSRWGQLHERYARLRFAPSRIR